MSIIQKKEEYITPLSEFGNMLPDLLCDSAIGGDLEGLDEEEWIL